MYIAYISKQARATDMTTTPHINLPGSPVPVRLSNFDRECLNYISPHRVHRVGSLVYPTQFRLVRTTSGAFALTDHDTFNEWKPQGPFAYRSEAIVWAWRAWAFKTGQRQSGDLSQP